MRNSHLLHINEPETGKYQFEKMPLFRLAFRPFYLLAALFAAIGIPLWLAGYTGHLPSMPSLDLNWHMHEMVFGFALAVIIGFLMTAARNWSGLWTPRGWPLAGLALLWLAGRLAMICLSALTAAVLDLAFIPLAAWPLYAVIKKSGNTRNMPLLGLLALLFLANVFFHASRLGYLPFSPLSSIQAAILFIVILETVMAGRVIPGFTANAIPGVVPRTSPLLNKLALILLALASLGWVLQLPASVAAVFSFSAAITQAVRLWGWKSWKTSRHPLLWILHLSYGWIVIGLFLVGMAELGLIAASTAFHALAVGSMSGLILGMITRTALGHTGRLLKVDYREITMYLLLQIGILARICANIPFAQHRNMALFLAMICWSSAFLLYLVVYVPYLCHARLDGREG